LFLIYIQKYCYASSLNNLDQVFVCARTAESCNGMKRHEAKCSLLIARYLAAILYIALTANICS